MAVNSLRVFVSHGGFLSDNNTAAFLSNYRSFQQLAKARGLTLLVLGFMVLARFFKLRAAPGSKLGRWLRSAQSWLQLCSRSLGCLSLLRNERSRRFGSGKPDSAGVLCSARSFQ